MFEEIIAKFSIINERPQLSSSRTQILSSIYINIPIPTYIIAKPEDNREMLKTAERKDRFSQKEAN